jgi:phosphoserine phosphatase/putative flippase GtrA
VTTVNFNVYDFDKTIYDGDSTIDFYLYCLSKHKSLIKFLPIQVYALAMYLLGKYNKNKFKENFFSFVKGINNIDEDIENFWQLNLKKIKPWYTEQQKKNDIIISASPYFLLKPIEKLLNIKEVIATDMNKKNGKIKGKNCYGEEKVKRLNKIYNNFIINNFYSDSLSDAPLAELAKEAYLVNKNELIPWQNNSESKLKNLYLSREFIIFLFIGVINTINGVLFAYLYSIFLDPNIAFILGYITSLTISYLLNSIIAFKESLALEKYVKFCISYIPNFIIQNIVVIIFLNILELDKLIAYIVAAIIGVPITFLCIKFFAFKKK